MITKNRMCYGIGSGFVLNCITFLSVSFAQAKQLDMINLSVLQASQTHDSAFFSLESENGKTILSGHCFRGTVNFFTRLEGKKFEALTSPAFFTPKDQLNDFYCSGMRKFAQALQKKATNIDLGLLYEVVQFTHGQQPYEEILIKDIIASKLGSNQADLHLFAAPSTLPIRGKLSSIEPIL